MLLQGCQKPVNILNTGPEWRESDFECTPKPFPEATDQRSVAKFIIEQDAADTDCRCQLKTVGSVLMGKDLSTPLCKPN